MRYLVSTLFASVLTITLFAPTVEASKLGSGITSTASLSAVASDKHMASGGGDLRAFFDWLRQILNKFFGTGGYGGSGGYTGGYNGTPKGSVPIPGSLLLFGGGFAGLVIWRARRLRTSRSPNVP
jgi:hypothetical protein